MSARHCDQSGGDWRGKIRPRLDALLQWPEGTRAGENETLVGRGALLGRVGSCYSSLGSILLCLPMGFGKSQEGSKA